MNATPMTPASVTQTHPQALTLAGSWTARGMGADEEALLAGTAAQQQPVVVDASGIAALDSAGAWVLHKLLAQHRSAGTEVTLQGLPTHFSKLLELVAQRATEPAAKPAPMSKPALQVLQIVGQIVVNALSQVWAMLAFMGESAQALAVWLRYPARIRWRPVLFNLRSAGFDALPIVGLLSFLLGVVVAYQGADQLAQYGANIFVADLVGLSMLREFAPLITAIIVAGRSGSAYAAQIGTMAVTEEIDAMRTIGIEPVELLVLPKILALAVALPLLTVFADGLGVFGGMLMAKTQLGVGYGGFLDRLGKAVSITSYLVGIGKAPVFAVIIALVGCFQGFRTHGGADSVGRQTTRSVVQSIFLVIVADALFSVAFSLLDL
jgi:phospholipid/cholesterol/gamma-HCH transport system permease protein